MPERILRDWTDSQAMTYATEHGESLFVRIIQKADDFGLYVADPQLLRSVLYPRRDDLRNAEMSRRLILCQKPGLIRCFEVALTGATRWLDDKELSGVPAVGAKWYLVIPKSGQRIRENTKPKYPIPPAFDGEPPELAALRGRSPPYANANALTYANAQAQNCARASSREKKPKLTGEQLSRAIDAARRNGGRR